MRPTTTTTTICTTIARLPRHHLSRRFLTTTSRAASTFKTGPSPPRLPKEEQTRFEELQRASTGAFSTPSPSPARINQSSSSPSSSQSAEANQEQAQEGDEEQQHPNLRRGAKPEFEGDTNPSTGEVGGPKNEPLRWGSAGDWSFNGRVTDF